MLIPERCQRCVGYQKKVALLYDDTKPEPELLYKCRVYNRTFKKLNELNITTLNCPAFFELPTSEYKGESAEEKKDQ